MLDRLSFNMSSDLGDSSSPDPIHSFTLRYKAPGKPQSASYGTVDDVVAPLEPKYSPWRGSGASDARAEDSEWAGGVERW